MQTVSFKIWTWVVVTASISYNDNHYMTNASINDRTSKFPSVDSKRTTDAIFVASPSGSVSIRQVQKFKLVFKRRIYTYLSTNLPTYIYA